MPNGASNTLSDDTPDHFAADDLCVARLESQIAVSIGATGDTVARTAVVSGDGWCAGANAFEVTIDTTSPTASHEPEILVGIVAASALQALLDSAELAEQLRVAQQQPGERRQMLEEL